MTIKEILREIPHIRYRLESDRYKDVLNEIEDILKKTSVNPQEPKTEQWQELKETIIELRDNNGMCTQQEVCKFLANLMNVLEKQMQEPKTDKENIHREREQAYMQGYEDACKKYRQEPKTGYWEYGYAFADGEYGKCSECKEILKCIYPMHYCPNCGAKMFEP